VQQRNRAASSIESVNSVFFSSGDRDLGAAMKVLVGSQASSRFEAWNSAFLSSCKRGIILRVLIRRFIRAFSLG